MSFWLLAAFLLLISVFAVIWPLLSRVRMREDASDVQIYKDQLLEIDRDLAQGLVSEAEHDASRVEIARRLLKAAERKDAAISTSRQIVQLTAVGLLMFLPAATLAAYLMLGSPSSPDQPLQARMEQLDGEQNITALVARVEGHLANNPEDGQGWLVLAPVYVKMGRVADASDAYSRALKLVPPTAELWSSYGETLVMQSSGMVTEAARKAFEQAAGLEPGHVKSAFFLAMAMNQERKFAEAEKAWTALLRDAPEEAPWVRVARLHLEAAREELGEDGTAEPGPSRQEVEAASEMSEADRQAFIASMVEGLRERLDDQGGTVSEWTRLMRAYMVMGREEDARLAYARAKQNLAGNAADIEGLSRSAGELGIDIGDAGSN